MNQVFRGVWKWNWNWWWNGGKVYSKGWWFQTLNTNQIQVRLLQKEGVQTHKCRFEYEYTDTDTDADFFICTNNYAHPGSQVSLTNVIDSLKVKIKAANF